MSIAALCSSVFFFLYSIEYGSNKDFHPNIFGVVHVDMSHQELQQSPESASCCRRSPWATWRLRSTCRGVPPLQFPSQVAVGVQSPRGRPVLGGFCLNPGEAWCPPQQPEHLKTTDKVVSDDPEAAGRRDRCMARCWA